MASNTDRIWPSPDPGDRHEAGLRPGGGRDPHLYDRTPIMLHSVDPEGRLIFVSDYWLEVMGYERDEVIGRQSTEFLTEESRQRAAETIPKFLAAGEVRDVPYRFRRKSGEEFDAELSAVLQRDDEGRFLQAIGVIVEVTRRKRIERELADANSMLQLVLDTIPVRVFWKDLESRYLGCNRLFAEDAGKSRPEDVIGEDDFAMGWRAEAELYRRDDREVMETRIPRVNHEEPQTAPDGRRIWLRTRKLPIRNAEEQVIGVLGTYEDITREKKAAERQRKLEAEIQHAQKLESLGVLAGGIAHDFNNILTGILGHIELSLGRMSPASPARDNLKAIHAAALRAADLCRQMLAYSGKGHFVIETVDLSAVIREMGHILEVSVSRKAEIAFELSDRLPAVEADVAQLRQLVTNLLTNASEAFGDEPGRIRIRTCTRGRDEEPLPGMWVTSEIGAGDCVCLEVTDTGAGMTEETKRRLFEPFYSTKFAGRGLGLSAVLGMVRGHRGAVQIQSRLGVGTTIRVYFPVPSREPEETGRRDPRGSHWRGDATVLLAEDEEFVREVAREMLEPAGLTVLTARDGREAVEVFLDRDEEIDLVLLDLTMPRMDGVEAVRVLREIREDVKVVLLSGYPEQEVAERFADTGVAGFVQKPFQRSALLEAVRDALAD